MLATSAVRRYGQTDTGRAFRIWAGPFGVNCNRRARDDECARLCAILLPLAATVQARRRPLCARANAWDARDSPART